MSISTLPNSEPAKDHYVIRRELNKFVKISAEVIKNDLFGALLIFSLVVIAISELFGLGVNIKFYAVVFIILIYVIFRDFYFNYNKAKDIIHK